MWLSWLGVILQSERSWVLFLVRAHARLGCTVEGTHQCFSFTSMFPSLSFSLLSPLSKNK